MSQMEIQVSYWYSYLQDDVLAYPVRHFNPQPPWALTPYTTLFDLAYHHFHSRPRVRATRMNQTEFEKMIFQLAVSHES